MEYEMNPNTYDTRHAFTLIELLVVISIVSLLIAILLPALGSARKAAENMQCLSNLRSINMAAISYGTDYQDQIVMAQSFLKSGPYIGDYLMWQYALSKHMGLSFYNADGTPITRPSEHTALAPWTGTILNCPSAQPASTINTTRPYHCNNRFQPGFFIIPGNKMYQCHKFNAIVRPAMTSFFADGATQTLHPNTSLLRYRSEMSYMLKGSPWYRETRHANGKSSNFSYVDGHATSETYDSLADIINDSTYTTGRSRDFWYGGYE
jgi:prepilin-type N-terminal cleavage/methylation domain-containing protein/prepilin-type processing-associated H-X9-DG protein